MLINVDGTTWASSSGMLQVEWLCINIGACKTITLYGATPHHLYMPVQTKQDEMEQKLFVWCTDDCNMACSQIAAIVQEGGVAFVSGGSVCSHVSMHTRSVDSIQPDRFMPSLVLTM